MLIFVVSCGSNKSVARRPVTKKTTTIARTVKRPVTRPVARGNENATQEVLTATSQVTVTTAIVLEYIENFKDVAKQNMVQHGIPASITLAQGILESGAGTAPLCRAANNHFGIKCHKEWTGDSVLHDDDAAGECFRKYKDPAESFRDHSYFLTSRPRYAALFKLDRDDHKAWARGLRAAGYATDPKYPDKLIGIIERYQLDRFDAEVMGKGFDIPAPNQIAATSNIYHVTQGDTLYSISRRFNITVDELRRKNNIPDNTISIGQQLIIN